MGFHDPAPHRRPDSCSARTFLYAGFRRSEDIRAAQEDAWFAAKLAAEQHEAQVQRRIQQLEDAKREVALDNAARAQPHAFPGHCPSPIPAGVGAATSFPLLGVAAPERSLL